MYTISSRIALLLVIMGVCYSPLSTDEDVNDRIYRNTVMGIRNIISAKEAISVKLAGIDQDSKELYSEKEKVQQLAQSLDGISHKRVLKCLKDLRPGDGSTDLAYPKQSNFAQGALIVAGCLAGIGLGLLVGNRLGKRRAEHQHPHHDSGEHKEFILRMASIVANNK
jgi:hypothetical protein